MGPHKQFEHFMRYELPTKLNLSPSKQMAFEIEFEYFSDLVKDLVEKAPEEFKYFFSDFKDHVERVARWKCPRTHEIVLKSQKDREGFTSLAKTADGKYIYHPKEKKSKHSPVHLI